MFVLIDQVVTPLPFYLIDALWNLIICVDSFMICREENLPDGPAVLESSDLVPLGLATTFSTRRGGEKCKGVGGERMSSGKGGHTSEGGNRGSGKTKCTNREHKEEAAVISLLVGKWGGGVTPLFKFKRMSSPWDSNLRFSCLPALPPSGDWSQLGFFICNSLTVDKFSVSCRL